jgi:predicted PP-loop superfamily ATPase
MSNTHIKLYEEFENSQERELNEKIKIIKDSTIFANRPSVQLSVSDYDGKVTVYVNGGNPFELEVDKTTSKILRLMTYKIDAIPSIIMDKVTTAIEVALSKIATNSKYLKIIEPALKKSEELD